MATSTERIVYDIVAHDRNAKKTFDETALAVDKAGDSFDHLGKDSKVLDERISQTRGHLAGLIAEFENTGDKTLFRDIRKDRSTLSLLQAMRKEVAGIGDDAEKAGPKISKSLTSSLLDGLTSIASANPVITAGVGIGVALAPAIGAAIGGAVLGAVGAGGIIGGVALAAQDPRVKAAGSALGANLMSGLKGAASPFVGPLLTEFNTLERAGDTFTRELGDGFKKLAPLVRPLARGIEGLVDNLGPGLSDAFSGAQPVIRAVANELPKVGAALSDMLHSIASESDGGVEGLLSLLHATEFLARATGDLVGQLEYEYQHLVDLGGALDDLKQKVPALSIVFGGGFAYMTDEATKLKGGLDDATSANHDFYLSMLDTVSATDAERKALQDFSSALQDQFDPVDNLIHRLQDVKQAQKDYNQAVKDHGPHSQAAKDANLKLAEAVIAADGAAANASGTFNGELTPALKATLKAAGMTDAQIADVGKQFRDAMHKGEDFAKTYKATALLEFYSYRAGERNPSGKASGGPVTAGQSYMVGENGPELITPSANGYVHTASATRSMLSGASGGSVDVNVRIDPSGARDELAALVLKMLRIDAGFRASVASYVGAS